MYGKPVDEFDVTPENNLAPSDVRTSLQQPSTPT
jgi:hypothetical protein